MCTKIDFDKAAYRAVLFYNSRNKLSFEDKKCRLPMCKEGKCICLDTLQLQLLCPLTCKKVDTCDEHIVFKVNDGSRAYFTFSNAGKAAVGVCEKRSDLPFDLCDFGRFDKNNYSKELNIIAKNSTIPKRIFSIFQGISVFFLVNSTEELQRRDSELYFAVYGYEPDVLLKELFIGVMETVIEKSLKGESLNGVDKAIEHICNRLHYLAMNKNENLNRIVDILETFDNCMESANVTIESYLGDDIIDYREIIGLMSEQQQGKNLGDEERRFVEKWMMKERDSLLRVLPIYALAKAVCFSAGLKVNWPEELWIEKMLQGEGEIRDYDVVFLIDKLNTVLEENHEERRNIVLEKLRDMLKTFNPRNGSFSSEDIEYLRHLA